MRGTVLEKTDFQIKTSLGKKYLFSLALSTVILSVCICTVVSLIFKARIMERYEYVGFSVSDQVAAMIDGDVIKYLMDEGLDSLLSQTVYEENRNFLAETAKRFDLIYLYVAIPEEDHLIYIWDAGEGTETFLDEEEYSPGGKEWSLKMLNNQGERKLHTFHDPQYGSVATSASPIYDRSGNAVALAYCDFSLEKMISGIISMIIGTIVFIILLMAIYTVVFYLSAKKSIVDPIRALTAAAQDITDNLEDDDAIFVSVVNTGDEIEALSRAFENMDRKLRDYIEENSRIVAEKERIGTELSLAAQIQSSSLPSIFPPFPDRTEFDIYATMDPAKAVGGDFYDFFMVDDDHLGLVIADVSDKGIPASLFMMVSKILINSNSMLGGSTSDVIMRVNDSICQTNTNNMFVTVWIGFLELSTGKLRATNAGHEFPCIRRPGGQFEFYKDQHGLVVGAMAGVPYTEYELTLEHGSTLYVYTDGVPDATNESGERFGDDRILLSLNKDPDADVKTLLDNVRISIDEFVKDAPQFDDTTMLAIKYK